MAAQIPSVELDGPDVNGLMPRSHGAVEALEPASEEQIEQGGLARVVEAQQYDVARFHFQAHLLKKSSQP